MSSEDILAHFGVKGMKWGVRKDARSSRKLARQERDKAIKTARQKQARKELKVYKDLAKLPFGPNRAKRASKLGSDFVDLFMGENVKVARQSTSGEKRTAALLLGATGALTAATIYAAGR